MNTPQLRVNLEAYTDALDTCYMIAAETECAYTDSDQPFIFTPEDHKQYHAVRDLLREFDIGYRW